MSKLDHKWTKWTKIDQTGPKILNCKITKSKKIGPNRSKLTKNIACNFDKINQYRQKFTKIDRTRPKFTKNRPKMEQMNQKWTKKVSFNFNKIDQTWPKNFKIDHMGQNGPKATKSDQNRSKWTKMFPVI